jgi:hypothetical protein
MVIDVSIDVCMSFHRCVCVEIVIVGLAGSPGRSKASCALKTIEMVFIRLQQLGRRKRSVIFAASVVASRTHEPTVVAKACRRRRASPSMADGSPYHRRDRRSAPNAVGEDLRTPMLAS